MKKNMRQRMTNPEPARQRRLELSRETVKILDASELARAAGGCDTTSFSTARLTTNC